MGQHSAIEWTDHTFNPWWGCVRVSPGCTNCYAEAWAKRYGHNIWGVNSPRRFFSDNHWRQPVLWNKQAASTGQRARVFCASMADVFEDYQILDEHRDRLWTLIEQTPHLDWLLLTKRPENINRLSPWKRVWPDNVWAMVTVEEQQFAEKRIPILIQVPSVVRGLSVEPMLGPVNLRPWLNQVQWVIVGGESGAGARPMDPQWVRQIRDQCEEFDVPFFFKQWGNWVPANPDQTTELQLELGGIRREAPPMKRVRKKEGGRILDGLSWQQIPTGRLPSP